MVERIRTNSIFWKNSKQRLILFHREAILPELVLSLHGWTAYSWAIFKIIIFIFPMTPCDFCLIPVLYLFDVSSVQNMWLNCQFLFKLSGSLCSVIVRRHFHVLRSSWSHTRGKRHLTQDAKGPFLVQNYGDRRYAMEVSIISCLTYNGRDTPFLVQVKCQKHNSIRMTPVTCLKMWQLL